MDNRLLQTQLGEVQLGGMARAEQSRRATYTLQLGTVLGAYPALQLYDVSFGAGSRTYAVALGQSSAAGHGSAAGYTIGDYVMVIVDVRNPGVQAFVIGAYHAPQYYGGDPTRVQSFPPVSGFRPGDGADITDIIAGSVEARRRLPDYGKNAMRTLTEGDWAVFTRLGTGGVGVELMRVWLGGGPASMLEFWPDQQLARLASPNYMHFTAGAENTDRILGGLTEIVERRSYGVVAALAEHQPRELVVVGAMHSGRQRFLAPESVIGGDADAGGDEAALPALFHEYVGSDGSYTLTSAASITLQKYIGVSVPRERLDEADLGEPRPAGEFDAAVKPLELDVPAGIDGMVLALQAIDARVNHLARTGFDQMERDWAIDDPDPEIYRETIDRRDWRCLPRIVRVRSDGERKIYVGRAIVTVTDAGHIVLESADGCQITMGEGSITLQAPNNIVGIAGNDAYLLGGRAAGIQGRYVAEVRSPDGGTIIQSNTDVVMQSAGLSFDNGEDAVAIRSGGRVGIQGHGVVLDAGDSDVTMVASEGVVSWQAKDGFGAFGAQIMARLGGADVIIGGDASYIPNLTADRLTYHRLRFVSSVTELENWASYQIDTFNEHLSRVSSLRDVDELGRDPDVGDGIELPEFTGKFIFVEPPWLTFARMGDCTGDCDDTDDNTTWVSGIPSGWEYARVASLGYIDYSTGATRTGDKVEFSDVQTVPISELFPR